MILELQKEVSGKKLSEIIQRAVYILKEDHFFIYSTRTEYKPGSDKKVIKSLQIIIAKKLYRRAFPFFWIKEFAKWDEKEIVFPPLLFDEKYKKINIKFRSGVFVFGHHFPYYLPDNDYELAPITKKLADNICRWLE